MIICRTYEVDMEYLHVQMKGIETPARVKCVKVEETGIQGDLVAKDANGNVVGRFPTQNVVGWWTTE